MKKRHIQKLLLLSLFLLMAFNTVGALWMIVLDKQRDISTLKSMGATDATVHRIFLLEGFLLTLLGMGIGLVLAIGLYFVQKNWGIVRHPPGHSYFPADDGLHAPIFLVCPRKAH